MEPCCFRLSNEISQILLRGISGSSGRLMKNAGNNGTKWCVGRVWNSEFSTSSSIGVLNGSSGNDVKFFGTRRNLGSYGSPGFQVSEEVQTGVREGKPIVALESAIITHGMPYPDNIQTALHLQASIREREAIPATVGVINGQLTVGLSDEEIISLGSRREETNRPLIKVSRRDLPVAIAQKLDGGTTVSGTIIGAVKAGIHIFATGGIGGVHRGVENTYDISADLRELGRNQIAVVSAGVKSILDIGKTLEYLETEGVCVAVLKKKDKNNELADVCAEMKIGKDGVKSERIGRAKFPSFFTAESQFTAPYSIADELQAAHLVNSSINFKLQSGLLIAVPIPKDHEAEGQRIEEAVQAALEKAAKMGVHGKNITPFLLGEINVLTQGSSLAANKCLVENNVKVATQIAVLLAELRRTAGTQPASGNPEGGCNQRFINRRRQESSKELDTGDGKVNIDVGEFLGSLPKESRLRHAPEKRPVVVGGCSMDLILSVLEPDIVSDGRTHKARIRAVPGGVGRNMAEALAKLGHNPVLISPVGNDLFGRELRAKLKNFGMNTEFMLPLNNGSTAVYSALINQKGECLFGVGEMTVYDQMDAEMLNEGCKEVIRNASIVVLDANLSVPVLTAVMTCCHINEVPVWFEPTEVRKAKKILETPREVWPALRYLSPNLRELMSITEGMDQSRDLSGTPDSSGTNNALTFDLSRAELEFLFKRCFSLFPALELILFTKGKEGIQVISRGGNGNGFSIAPHPPPDLREGEIKSVSGAGDCLNAGFISGILRGAETTECAIQGTECAKKSLLSWDNVPELF